MSFDRPARSTLAMLRPALFWALLHAGLVLVFFHGGLSRSLGGVPQAMHLPLWVCFGVEALALAVAMWLVTLPLAVFRGAYSILAPLVFAIVFALLYLDSLLFDSLGFHFNGLIVQVALQPGALQTTGLSPWEVAGYVVAALAAIGLDAFAGSRFVRRFATPSRRAWTWPTAIVALWVAERLAVGTMAFYGGFAVLAAGTTLPLQPPVRLAGFLEKVTGKPPMYAEMLLRDLPKAGEAMGELEPAAVRFTRKPDVLVLLIESTRNDFFTPEVMPNLTRRAQADGRIFPRHYSGAPSTHFALFNLFYGLDAQRRDGILGAGRAPLLFPALKANGYATSFIASSSVDWMDLKDTVFRDVKDGLITGLAGESSQERDGSMVAKAREVISATPKDEPLFLFLFFDGTHFNYAYPERSAIFQPAWDGVGSIKAATVDAELLENRAKNALHEVDAKLEEFLSFYEAERGGKPLLIVTADHGEEFREHGRVGHGSDVTRGQIHVPLVIFDEKVPKGVHEGVTGHVDLVPTIFSLLGDTHDPGLYGDGHPVLDEPTDRYALATVGWEPKFAVVGKDLKVRFFSLDAGLGSIDVTDDDDRPLDDGKARFAVQAPKLLERLRGGLGSTRKAASAAVGTRDAEEPKAAQRDPAAEASPETQAAEGTPDVAPHASAD
ncbi:sulfatase-like hydrolase/transferase [Vulgatibacter incomptus]|uniref:Putative hydrolase n=1 Tax=Vulgatibacter incomptus TaxID=1391653 RepID=A0A0K1PHE5_9BACT|nr:sulfatase-like hydrolase/transferase [Vulgatibacter incomptus]AKU92932.1 putative hydrolase [Vulgatibacter incomptus]